MARNLESLLPARLASALGAEGSVRRKTMYGAVWSFGGYGGKQLLRFISSHRDVNQNVIASLY